MAIVNRYIDPDVVGGAGDGTTWADAYSSMSAWEAAEETDLDTANDIHIANFRASSGTDDTTATTLLGWTTSVADYIHLLGNQVSGIFDSSKYVLTTTTGAFVLSVLEENVLIEKLQVYQQRVTDSNAILVNAPGQQGITINKCIVRLVDAANVHSGIISTAAGAGSVIDIINSIIYDVGTGGSARGVRSNDADLTMNLLNTTIYNSTLGVVRSNGTVTAKNCAIFNCTDDFNGAATINNCATEQGAGEGTAGVAITQTADNYAALVVDAAGGNFNVTDASSELYNAGTNIGAPPDDIIGTARPQAVTTDIGAFELFVGTTAPPTTLPPTTLAPTTLAPTTLEPTTLPPTTLPPTTLEPTPPPTTLAPTTLPPTTLPPTTLPPTTLEPTQPPTTLPPTTLKPTTLPPTTLEPTTLEPTTLEPTTLAPTTIITTLAPTTVAPTTIATTLAPTTLPPTTVAPTTIVTTLAPTTLPPTTFIGQTTVSPTTFPEPTTLPPTSLAPTTVTLTTPAPPDVRRRGYSRCGLSLRSGWR